MIEKMILKIYLEMNDLDYTTFEHKYNHVLDLVTDENIISSEFNKKFNDFREKYLSDNNNRIDSLSEEDKNTQEKDIKKKFFIDYKKEMSIFKYGEIEDTKDISFNDFKNEYVNSHYIDDKNKYEKDEIYRNKYIKEVYNSYKEYKKGYDI